MKIISNNGNVYCEYCNTEDIEKAGYKYTDEKCCICKDKYRLDITELEQHDNDYEFTGYGMLECKFDEYAEITGTEDEGCRWTNDTVQIFLQYHPEFKEVKALGDESIKFIEK